MNSKEHRDRHIELHKALDELVADFGLQHIEKRLSQTSVIELLQWSKKESEQPTEIKESDYATNKTSNNWNHGCR